MDTNTDDVLPNTYADASDRVVVEDAMNEFTKNIVRLLGVAVTAVRCAKRGARRLFIEPTYVERNLRAARDALREAVELLEGTSTWGSDVDCDCNVCAYFAARPLTRTPPAPRAATRRRRKTHDGPA